MGALCGHKIAVNSKGIDRELSTKEEFCKYQCNGIEGCNGYIPLQEIKDFNNLFYNKHLHPKK